MWYILIMFNVHYRLMDWSIYTIQYIKHWLIILKKNLILHGMTTCNENLLGGLIYTFVRFIKPHHSLCMTTVTFTWYGAQWCRGWGWNLLNQLLPDIYDTDKMMSSLGHLRHLLGGTRGVEDLQMRPDHLNSIHIQIFWLILHVVEEKAADVVEEDVHYHICSNRILWCY